jgi:hypothetical protein
MDPRRHPGQVIPSPEISRISRMVWRPMMETPHHHRGTSVIQSSAAGHGIAWHPDCPPSFPMNTPTPNPTQLVPALDRLPSATIAAPIGDLDAPGCGLITQRPLCSMKVCVRKRYPFGRLISLGPDRSSAPPGGSPRLRRATEPQPRSSAVIGSATSSRPSSRQWRATGCSPKTPCSHEATAGCADCRCVKAAWSPDHAPRNAERIGAHVKGCEENVNGRRPSRSTSSSDSARAPVSTHPRSLAPPRLWASVYPAIPPPRQVQGERHRSVARRPCRWGFPPRRG